MAKKQNAWLIALVSLGLTLATSFAAAQTINDFPTLKGTNGRTGRNGSPTNNTPGLTNLGWPAADGYVVGQNQTIVDNTDFANTNVAPFVGGPYDVNAKGTATSSPTVSSSNNPATGWAYPTVANEASDPYLEAARLITTASAPTYNYNLRFPAYFYTNCTPSAPGGDGTTAVTPSDLRTFTWTFKGQNSSVPMSISLWVPIGPTASATGTAIYPQRYFVYAVNYGPSLSQRQVYTLDTYAAGGGFVQLGGPTVQFPITSTQPITVTLYNTVPRDPSTGSLLQLVNGQVLPQTPAAENEVKQFVVYADAAALNPTFGPSYATPSSATLSNGNIRVTTASNDSFSSSVGSSVEYFEKGVVSDYPYNNGGTGFTGYGVADWKFSPLEESTSVNNVDNNLASVTTLFVTETGPSAHQGANYDQAPVTTTAPPTATATYAPNLADGSYTLYAFLPGSTSTVKYGRAVQYQINEGSTQTVVTVNQDAGGGWVQIGTRAYVSASTGAGPLSVVVTNQSTNTSDTGRYVYADAIRFVGGSSLEITSSPIHANCLIKISPLSNAIATDVVIVADESGRIHCLNAIGNSSKKTTEYWTYPSTPDPNNSSWIDPNLNPSSDKYPVPGGVYDGSGGTLLAEMPNGFNLSSGLIQRINGADYLFIATNNGRVYCIAMAGRGEFNASEYLPGTTQRVWTYPSTYPAAIPVPSSSLGPFQGSVAYAQLQSGKYAIFAPSSSGRIYALDAAPGTSDGTTDVLWAFPQVNAPNLAPVVMTPSVDSFGVSGGANLYLYFGTLATSSNPGRFFCINANTGAEQWEAAPVQDPVTLQTPAFSDFTSGPATVPGALMDSVAGATSVDADTVYVTNQNEYTYAFNAYTGTNIWLDNEENSGATGGLTYAVISAYDNTGVVRSFPMVVVPGQVGQFYGLFARAGDTNVFGERLGWGYASYAPLIAGTSNSNKWLYGADTSGYLYAFDNSLYTGSNAPGADDITPDNPAALPYEDAQVQLITQSQYALLRQGGTDFTTGTTTGKDTRNSPFFYDVGETIYVLVYDFPFATVNTSGKAVNPPIMNMTISTAGQSTRVSAESLQWNPSSSAPKSSGGVLLDGYAVMSFTLNQGGPQSLPPGPGTATFAMTTQALNGAGAVQQIQLNPKTARLTFSVANPLAISVGGPAPGSSSTKYSIGYNVDPSDPQNGVNGNAVPSQPWLNNLLSSLGQVPHNTRGTSKVYVYDRSLMSAILPPGQGLQSVGTDLHDLAWEGDSANVYKPINAAVYPGMEDLPVNYPNTSLDYPNISHFRISVVKEQNGATENPTYNGSGATLNPPLYQTSPGVYGQMPYPIPSLTSRLANEVLQPTEFDFSLDVPKYQPPNMLTDGAVPDEYGNTDPTQQGYLGRINVYVVNPSQTVNGVLNLGNAQTPYRSFNYAVSVLPDARLSVATPNVDLGSISSGIGLPPTGIPPSGLPSAGYFGNIVVNNDGNVNLLDLRIAKSTTTFSSVPEPWGVFTTSADPNVLLDSTYDLWSDIDATYAPKEGSGNKVILQKARTTDQVPTTLTVYPAYRYNPNTGTAGTPGSGTPNVGVTLPIGLPSGTYSSVMRLIENDPAYSNESLDQIGQNSFESYSDPTFNLSFSVRETRLTNGVEPYSLGGMADSNYFGSSPLAYSNLQPTAMRNASGGLVAAWVSDRPSQSPTSGPTTAQRDHAWRIFLAGLSNTSQFTNSTILPPSSGRPSTMPYSPLVDLDTFTNGGGATWFAPSSSSAASGYPAVTSGTANTLFGPGTGESIPLSTVAFGAPSFPTGGQNDPFSTSLLNYSYMGFVGQAQKTTPTGDVPVSRLFGTQVTYGANGSVTAASTPDLIVTDDQIVKGKPSVLQTGPGALLFYPGVSANASTIYVAQYPVPALTAGETGVPADHNSSPLNFGTGFVTVDSPSAVGRVYTGANTVGNTGGQYVPHNGDHIVELTFGGKLRGQPSEEVFSGRLELAQGQVDVARDSTPSHLPSPFLYLPVQYFERLSAGSTSGTYRVRGIGWNMQRLNPNPTSPFQQIQLIQQVAGGPPTNLLLDGFGDPDSNLNFTPSSTVPNTEVIDRETGLISFDTRLGGKVYIDPSLGTIRFSTALPSASAELRLTYQPRFLRVVQGGAAEYSGVTGLFDNRIVSDPFDLNGSSFVWRTQSGALANPTNAITNDRFVYTFNRASSGAGQTSRPYMNTMRFGVRLLNPIYVDGSGNPSTVTVTGNTGPYQLDPVNGRVYFTAVDEDQVVSINYTPMDTGTGAAGAPITESNAPVGVILENDEQPILLDQAVNESSLHTFLDPFSYLLPTRRPPLMWMFWTSTRNGVPDVYFQTLAPALLPRPKTGN